MAHTAGQPAPEAEELPQPLPSPEPPIPRGTVGSDTHLGLSVSCPEQWEETHAQDLSQAHSVSYVRHPPDKKCLGTFGLAHLSRFGTPLLPQGAETCVSFR